MDVNVKVKKECHKKKKCELTFDSSPILQWSIRKMERIGFPSRRESFPILSLLGNPLMENGTPPTMVYSVTQSIFSLILKLLDKSFPVTTVEGLKIFVIFFLSFSPLRKVYFVCWLLTKKSMGMGLSFAFMTFYFCSLSSFCKKPLHSSKVSSCVLAEVTIVTLNPRICSLISK